MHLQSGNTKTISQQSITNWIYSTFKPDTSDLTYPCNDAEAAEDGHTLFGLHHSSYDLLLEYSNDIEPWACELGVIPLSEFTGEDADPDDASQWFDPSEGLKTVVALLDALPTADVGDEGEITVELLRLQHELKMLKESGRRFIFGLG